MQVAYRGTLQGISLIIVIGKFRKKLRIFTGTVFGRLKKKRVFLIFVNDELPHPYPILV